MHHTALMLCEHHSFLFWHPFYTAKIVMFVGVWSLYESKKVFLYGSILVLSGVGISAVNVFLNSMTLSKIILFILTIFCLLSVIVTMRQILFGDRIDANKMFGSISIYLLIGMIWAMIYIFISYIHEDAFKGMTETAFDERSWEFVYYSFVTLTTLGYGDITPVTPFARSVSYLEAVCGQFYIAILVASLVSAQFASRDKGSK